MPFNLQVQGDISNIADFVTNIKIVFPTSVVDAYQFTMGKQTADPETPDGGIPASSDPTPVVAPPSETLQVDSANINIIIYSYKGDANVE